MDVNTNTGSTAPSDAGVAARVEAILGGMSLYEKVGQLTQLGLLPNMLGANPEDVIRLGGAGSVLWLTDRKQYNVLQKIAVEADYRGIGQGCT